MAVKRERIAASVASSEADAMVGGGAEEEEEEEEEEGLRRGEAGS